MNKLVSFTSEEALSVPKKNITNRRIVLKSRPIGFPVATNFKLEEGVIPTPSKGLVLLRTLYLSLDPYMRGRMSSAESYAPSILLNDVIVGATVSIVEISFNEDYQLGDFVLSANGWQEYALSDGKGLFKLTNDIAQLSLNLVNVSALWFSPLESQVLMVALVSRQSFFIMGYFIFTWISSNYKYHDSFNIRIIGSSKL